MSHAYKFELIGCSSSEFWYDTKKTTENLIVHLINSVCTLCTWV